MSISNQIANIIHSLRYETKQRQMAEERLASIQEMLSSTRNVISSRSGFCASASSSRDGDDNNNNRISIDSLSNLSSAVQRGRGWHLRNHHDDIRLQLPSNSPTRNRNHRIGDPRDNNRSHWQQSSDSIHHHHQHQSTRSTPIIHSDTITSTTTPSTPSTTTTPISPPPHHRHNASTLPPHHAHDASSPNLSPPHNHKKTTIKLSNYLHLNLLKELIFNLQYRIEQRIQDQYSEVIVLETEHLKSSKQLIEAPSGNQVTILYVTIENFDQICLFDPREALQMMHQTYHFLIERGMERYRGYEFTRQEDLYGIAFHSSFEAMQFASYLQKESLLMNYELKDQDHAISEKRLKLLQLPFLKTVTNHEESVIFRGFRIKIGVCVGAPNYKIDSALHNTVNWGDSWAGNIWHEMDPRTLRFNYYGSVVDHAKSIMQLARGGETLVTRQVWNNIKKLVYARGFDENLWMKRIEVEFASERETQALQDETDSDDEASNRDGGDEEQEEDATIFIEKHLEDEYAFLHETELRRVLPEFLKSRQFTKPVSRIPVELQYERLINQYLQLKLSMVQEDYRFEFEQNVTDEMDDSKQSTPNIFHPTEFKDQVLLTPLDILTHANIDFTVEDPSMDTILPRTTLISPELLLSQEPLNILGFRNGGLGEDLGEASGEGLKKQFGEESGNQSNKQSTEDSSHHQPTEDPSNHQPTEDSPNHQLTKDASNQPTTNHNSIQHPPSPPPLEQNISILEKQINKLKDSNSYLRFQLSQKTREADDLEIELKQARERLELSVTEEMIRETKRLKKEGSSLRDSVSKLRKRVHARDSELTQAYTTIDERDQTIQELRAQLEEMQDYKQHTKTLFDTVSQQKEDIKVLSEENKRLLARLRVDEILLQPSNTRGKGRDEVQQFLFSPTTSRR